MQPSPDNVEPSISSPILPDKKSDSGLFVGVIGIVVAILIPVLQANGVDVNWQVSVFVYVVLVAICDWSFLKHAAPYSVQWKRLGGILILSLIIGGLGSYATVKQYHREHQLPPKTKNQVIDELTTLAQRRDWTSIDATLSSLERDSNFRDVVLYFRGIIYSNAHPTSIDPDQYLSLVPQDSTLFSNAQRVRLANWAANPNDRLKNAIVDSMERANLKTPVYFRLRLETPPPTTSYHDIANLYEEFVGRYHEIFDFNEMKPAIRAQAGTPMYVNLFDLQEIPGCTLLFILREIEAARQECRVTAVNDALAQYEVLVRNIDNAKLEMSLRSLAINPVIIKSIEKVKQGPISKACTK